jgi:Holliday junction resolvase RusA-like endonuclease
MDDELRTLYVKVDGRPAPQGSKSAKGVNKKTGHTILAESSKYVRPWRKAVHMAAMEAITNSDWTITDRPVQLTVEFFLHRPQDRPKRSRVYPTRYPDLSKLVRSTEDALTSAGVWKDDAQIVDTSSHKRYAIPEELEAIYNPFLDLTAPGVIITVRELPYSESL